MASDPEREVTRVGRVEDRRVPPHATPPPSDVYSIAQAFQSFSPAAARINNKRPPLVLDTSGDDLGMRLPTDINWTMLDKGKFLPYSVACSFSVRTFIYPLTVVKTRLQVQKRLSIYSGTLDAFVKTLRYEGVRGLYKGFWINSTQAVSGIFYILTYESVRHLVTTYTPVKDRKVGSLVGGAAASMVGITLINPIDVISQHMMLHGQYTPAHTAAHTSATHTHTANTAATATLAKKSPPHRLDYTSHLARGSRFGVAGAVTTAVYRQYGLRGFYKGYLAAIMLYSPNSAIWWFTYQHYIDLISLVSPAWLPLTIIQCVAAPASGATAALITNPLDIIRVRLQVEGRYTFISTSSRLWREEGLNMFLKGLSARMPLSMIFSFLIATGYEAIKRLSVKDEYKHHVKW